MSSSLHLKSSRSIQLLENWIIKDPGNAWVGESTFQLWILQNLKQSEYFRREFSIQTEMCCMYKIHTRFQRLRTKKVCKAS